MKNLKIQLKLFGLLALIAVSLFQSSCKQEVIEDLPNSENQKIDLETAPFKKEIVTRNEDGVFTFELSSNNSDVLNVFDNTSVSFTFLDENEIEELIENQNSHTQDDSEVEQDASADPLNGPDFIGISLIKLSTGDHIDEIPPYELSLSEAVLKVIKATKTTTVFDFQSDVVINNESSRYTTLWSNNKAVVIRGDCGTTRTDTRSYWAYTGSSSLNWLFFNRFKCKAFIGSCCEGSSAWVRRVTVIKDVAPRIYGYRNTCYSSKCIFYESDNCSGYSPNGCY